MFARKQGMFPRTIPRQTPSCHQANVRPDWGKHQALSLALSLSLSLSGTERQTCSQQEGRNSGSPLAV